MATTEALGHAFQTLLDNGNRIPEGCNRHRIGQHWADFFQDVPDHELAAAIRSFVLARWSSAWPTVGAIMAHVPSRKAAERLESLEEGDEVFGEVLELVRARGSYWHPGPEDFHEDKPRSRAIWAGVRAAGGWRVLCNSGDRELMANRAAFRAAFKSHREKLDIAGTWRADRALENLGADGSPVSIAGVLEHLEIGG